MAWCSHSGSQHPWVPAEPRKAAPSLLMGVEGLHVRSLTHVRQDAPPMMTSWAAEAAGQSAADRIVRGYRQAMPLPGTHAARRVHKTTAIAVHTPAMDLRWQRLRQAGRRQLAAEAGARQQQAPQRRARATSCAPHHRRMCSPQRPAWLPSAERKVL